MNQTFYARSAYESDIRGLIAGFYGDEHWTPLPNYDSAGP
jgi:hypothetical protein